MDDFQNHDPNGHGFVFTKCSVCCSLISIRPSFRQHIEMTGTRIPDTVDYSDQQRHPGIFGNGSLNELRASHGTDRRLDGMSMTSNISSSGMG